MTLLLRALARLTGLLLLAILAAAGLALAVFSIQGGTATLSLAELSRLMHLPELGDTVGAFLRGLESEGPAAAVAGLSGAGAVLLGLGLLAGVLIPRRERLLVIERDGDGTLAARRRPAAQAIRAVAEQTGEVERAKARVRPRRTGVGGRLRLTVYRASAPSADQSSVVETARQELAPLSQALSLRVRARSREPRGSERVR